MVLLIDTNIKEIGADYIITCNTKDFENSEIPAINPMEFLKLMGNEDD